MAYASVACTLAFEGLTLAEHRDRGEFGLLGCNHRKASRMNIDALRAIVRRRLRDGSLPMNNIPRVWGGPGNGETCDVCASVVTKAEFVMDVISATDGRGVRLHVECFSVWESERAQARRVADSGPSCA